MEIKMIAPKSRTSVSLNTWLAASLFAAMVVIFALYVYAEKQVDHAHDMRHKSFLAAAELRQSSDDLTRMARSYIATGNPIYKHYYQDIIAIANGKLPRPQNYTTSYWELALIGKQPLPSLTEAPISMLELLRANGFTEYELDILKTSKADSDVLSNTELTAMALIEQAGPELESHRRQALSMVFGDEYNRTKVSIFQPINQFYQLQDTRTFQAVRQAEHKAAIILVLLMSFGLSLMFMLWRISQAVRMTLGDSADEIYRQIKLIGTGDFSAIIEHPKGKTNSVLTWLTETQQQLHKSHQDRIQAELARQSSDEKYRTLFENANIGIVIFLADPSKTLLSGNNYFCKMMGYEFDELLQLYPKDVVASSQTEEVAPAIDTIETNNSLLREWLLKRKDGSTFIAEVLSTVLPDGTMMSMVHDITERKLAETQLRHSEENLAITLQSIGDAVIATDTTGLITRMNPTAEKLTGWSFIEAFGKPLTTVFNIINANTRKPLRNPVELVMTHGNIVGLANHTALIARNGSEYQISDSAAPIRDSANNILGVVLVFSDISEKYQAIEALRRADERFRRTFKLIPNALTLQTEDGTLLDCSDAFCTATGFNREEMIGSDTLTLNLWANPKERTQMREQLLRDGQVENLELQLRRRNGEIVIMQLSARYLTTEPEPILLTVAHDVTARKQAELALQESALHTQAILDNMFDGVITINTKGVIESFNSAACTIFGYPAEEVLGNNITMLMPSHYKTQHATYLQHHDESLDGEVLNVLREVEGQRKNGEIFPMSLSITKILRTNKITFVGVVRDISQQRSDEEEIYRLAFYDPLTNLPNRRLLFDRLQQAIHTSCRNDQHGALMFLDLDHFKQLNDSLGHDVGDILLQQVALRLQACVRECDSVARMGGDEFVMLIEALSIYPNEAASQAETIAHKVLAALAQPYHLREHTYVITPSIGIVVFLHQQETLDELLKKADVAMYQAKTAGRNNARFFDPTMQAAVSVRVALEKSMRQALEHNEFLLHYQLQVDSKGIPTGVEALVRWNHSEHGMVSPAAFIPLAEETGMILALGQWVLETACAQLVKWSAKPPTANWTMAVNVSISQFAQPHFVANVTKALKKTGANPRLLKLELTESMLAKDVDDVVIKMFEIKALGVTFSLDDFGTGYSSLSYLKRLPLDQLKIDQSFVRDLLTDSNDATIARTIIALGHSLSLNVIAEGVETLEQRNALAAMGCDAYQGYYFARPMIAADLPKTLSTIPK